MGWKRFPYGDVIVLLATAGHCIEPYEATLVLVLDEDAAPEVDMLASSFLNCSISASASSSRAFAFSASLFSCAIAVSFSERFDSSSASVFSLICLVKTQSASTTTSIPSPTRILSSARRTMTTHGKSQSALTGKSANGSHTASASSTESRARRTIQTAPSTRFSTASALARALSSIQWSS